MYRNRTYRTLFPVTLLLLCVAALIGACGDDSGDATAEAGDHPTIEALPRPEGTRGSVTGMPDTPGPGHVGPPTDALAADGTLAVDALGLPVEGDVAAVDESAPVDGMQAGSTPVDTTTEPTPQDAVAVVRDYYAAINAQSFGRAYALWADGGRASGQSPQQFADGLAETAGVSVALDAPSRIDASAGARHVEVPVSVRVQQRDGAVRGFVGSITLRRSVAEGATPEQRAWRIAAADLREEGP